MLWCKGLPAIVVANKIKMIWATRYKYCCRCKTRAVVDPRDDAGNKVQVPLMQKKSGYEVYIGDPPFCTITFKGLFLAVLAHYPPHYIQTRTFSPIKSMRSPSAPHFFQVTSKSFNFAAKHKLPFFFVSASDGTNVVKIFQLAIKTGIKYQAEPKEDFYQEVGRRM